VLWNIQRNVRNGFLAFENIQRNDPNGLFAPQNIQSNDRNGLLALQNIQLKVDRSLPRMSFVSFSQRQVVGTFELRSV
jgi:hypothetical protein